MSNKVVIDKKKEDFMNYYKNQLCEINEGFYSLNKTGRSCGHHVAFKFKEIDLPEKIYTKYNDFKIKYKNIEDIKYMINNCEVESFDDKLLVNDVTKMPKKYSILIKFKGTEFNNRFYVGYDYNFSKLKYPLKDNKDSYYCERTKKDIEFKIFVLEKMFSKL